MTTQCYVHNQIPEESKASHEEPPDIPLSTLHDVPMIDLQANEQLESVDDISLEGVPSTKFSLSSGNHGKVNYLINYLL